MFSDQRNNKPKPSKKRSLSSSHKSKLRPKNTYASETKNSPNWSKWINRTNTYKRTKTGTKETRTSLDSNEKRLKTSVAASDRRRAR